MPLIRITSYTTSAVTLGRSFGTLRPYEEIFLDVDVSELEYVSDALVRLQKQGLLTWQVEHNAKQGDALEFFPSKASITKLSTPLHLYVSESNGSDYNDGRSPKSAFVTYRRAVEEINRWDVLAHHDSSPGAAIHLATGTYDLAEIAVLRGEVLVHGDGAGQPGDDGTADVLASTAVTADSSGFDLTVTGAGWTKDEFAGLFVEILDGPAAGSRRQIVRNTDSLLRLSALLDNVVTGNRFRIFQPTVVLKEPVAWYPTAPKQFSIMRRTADPFRLVKEGSGTNLLLSSSIGSRCVLANVEIKHDPPEGAPPPEAVFGDFGYFNIGTADVGGVVLYGVRFKGFVDEDQVTPPILRTLGRAVPAWGACIAGWDSPDPTFGADSSGRARQWGLTGAVNQWSGWGVSVVNRYFSPTPFAGTLAMRRDDDESNNVVGVEWYLRGSTFITNGLWALHVIGSTLRTHLAQNGDSYAYSDNDDPDLQGSCITVSAGSDVFLSGWRLEKENLGNGLFIGQFGGGQGSQPSVVSMHSNVEFVGVTGTSEPDAAIRMLVGGNVSSRIIPVTGFRRTVIVHSSDQARELEIVQEFTGSLGNSPPRHSIFPTPEQSGDFVANGPLSGYSDATTGTLNLALVIGGAMRAREYGLLDHVTLTQLLDGTAGNTTIELYRRRGNVEVRVAIATLAFGGGNAASVVVDLTDNAARDVRPNDQFFVQFTERQTGGTGVTVHVKSGGSPAFGTFTVL